MTDNLPHCDHEPRSLRLIALPLGSYSIAGTQDKVVAQGLMVCDDCWAKIKAATDEKRISWRASVHAPVTDAGYERQSDDDGRS